MMPTEYTPDRCVECQTPHFRGRRACVHARRAVEDIAREVVANYGAHGLVEVLERRIADAIRAERAGTD